LLLLFVKQQYITITDWYNGLYP